MRGLTTAVFFTVGCILLVAAAPKTKPNQVSSTSTNGEGSIIYPSDRTRPSSPSSRRRAAAGQNQNQNQPSEAGPYLFFREPKALGKEAWGANGVGSSWVRQGAVGGAGGGGGAVGVQQGGGYWPRYGFQQRGRDDEEEDEDDEDADEEDEADDIGDDADSGSEEEDDVAFDTPSWDSIYPPDETGGYARKNAPSDGVTSAWHQKPQIQQQQISDGSYTLSPGSPGAPGSNYQGRSGGGGGYNGPWSSQWGPKKNWGPGGGHRQVRRGPPPGSVFVRAQKKQQQQQVWEDDTEGPSPWYGQRQVSQGPTSTSTRWTDGTQAYYQPRPQYVRRSWNWRPSGPPPPPQRRYVQQVDVDVDSDEDSGEGIGQPQAWSGSGSGSGPRRVVKNWARTQPPTWGPPPRQSQKFGYY